MFIARSSKARTEALAISRWLCMHDAVNDIACHLILECACCAYPQNPNLVVGSGYIQHPPQRPFAQPLQYQPPTLAVMSLCRFCYLTRLEQCH